jgi:hypothetical protein
LDPLNPSYYFRRLFWSWLLSGGSASYGGRWDVLQPYSFTGDIPYTTHWVGTLDETTYTNRLSGLDSIGVISLFFTSREVNLAQFHPCIEGDIVSSEPDGLHGTIHGMSRGDREYVIYHPHAVSNGKDAAPDGSGPARFRFNAPSNDKYRVDWVRACNGEITSGGIVSGGNACLLTAPWVGQDVVAHIVAIYDH